MRVGIACADRRLRCEVGNVSRSIADDVFQRAIMDATETMKVDLMILQKGADTVIVRFRLRSSSGAVINI
ncbi:hypothetical protein EVB74_059 [Rhizobium phage RHph_Y3_56_1]|nr:hypothetical protein EVB59_060 [Rhizobium phage RHph_Y3_1]QIG78007.1 hypothetical protein EVB74_059 [Rhizobium phage RHph_Y3_56_1]